MEKHYSIEQLPNQPVFVITWGASNHFTPNDDTFISDVNETLNQFGQPVTLIMDTLQFAITIGNAMENMIRASSRPDTIPNNPYVRRIIFISHNRFVHLMVARLSRKHQQVSISQVNSLDEALALLNN